MMNLLNLHIDIMRLDSKLTDGAGIKTRIEELAKQLEKDEVRDDLIMIEEARLLGPHTRGSKNSCRRLLYCSIVSRLVSKSR